MLEKLKALFGIGHRDQADHRVPGIDTPTVDEARNKPNVEDEAAAANVEAMEKHRKPADAGTADAVGSAGAVGGDTNMAGRGAMLAGEESSHEEVAEKEMEESIRKRERRQ